MEEAEKPENSTIDETKKKHGKRKPLPKNLPRKRIELDILEEEKICSCCQGDLHKIGEGISEKLEFIPEVLRVLEYVRPKYACRHGEQNEENAPITQQPPPPARIPKSYATDSLLTQIILGKHQYALPFIPVVVEDAGLFRVHSPLSHSLSIFMRFIYFAYLQLQFQFLWVQNKN